MGKKVSEKEWERIYDQTTAGYHEKELPDGKVYTLENFLAYMRAVINMPDYIIVFEDDLDEEDDDIDFK